MQPRRNALVVWVPTETPWELEEELITSVPLPLKLDQNRGHPFHATLSDLRRAARRDACSRPVWCGA